MISTNLSLIKDLHNSDVDHLFNEEFLAFSDSQTFLVVAERLCCIF